MPDFSGFHPRFRPLPGLAAGDVRAAFYLAYPAEHCTQVTLRQAIDRAVAGEELVSAAFVTPYPPGFPVLVPGQVLSAEIAAYLLALAPADILGCDSGGYLRVFRPAALAVADADAGAIR
jgi:arginine/lysine/ornithine decarboxylase